jgi:SAM-dependent methyltransferase
LAESAEQERVSGVVGYYDKHALELSRRYDALSFETVHETLLPYLPRVPATAIDIGAGSGRDAIELAARGFDVVAIEPSGELIKAAKSKVDSNPVIWLRDNLPVLSSVPDCMTFDLLKERAGNLVHHLHPDGTAVRRGGNEQGQTRPQFGPRRRADGDTAPAVDITAGTSPPPLIRHRPDHRPNRQQRPDHWLDV